MTRVTLLSSLGGILIAAVFVAGVGVLTAQSGAPPTPANANTAPPAMVANDTRDEAKPQPPQPINKADAKGKERYAEYLKQITRMIDEVNVEIEALEKYVQRMTEVEHLVYNSDRELPQTTTDLVRVQNELLEKNSRIAVLQKRLDSKKPLVEVDIALLRLAANRDPRVITVSDSLARAKAEMVKLATRADAPADQTKALKLQIELFEEELTRTLAKARDEALEMMLATERHELKTQIANLSTEVEVLQRTADGLEVVQRKHAKSQLSGRTFLLSFAKVRQQLSHSLEMRNKLRWLRIQTELSKSVVVADTAEQKLDVLLQTITELKKEVQELKQRK